MVELSKVEMEMNNTNEEQEEDDKKEEPLPLSQEKEDMIEVYSKQLNQDLIKQLAEEKLKEDNREEMYNNCKDESEKIEIGERFEKERIQSKEIIEKLNKDIVNRINLYREKLKNHQNDNTMDM